MQYRPHEYQEYAKEFIIGQKISALFLDCGLGKTVITLKWEHLEGIEMSAVLGSEPERMKALNRRANVYVIKQPHSVFLVAIHCMGNSWTVVTDIGMDFPMRGILPAVPQCCG